MDQMPQPSATYKDRLTNAERLLLPTLPAGRDEYYNKIRSLMGKELNLAILDKTDVGSNLVTVQCARMMFCYGQEQTGRGIATDFLAELKMTSSIGGAMLDAIFQEKIQYEQTQNIHEYTEPPAKRSIFGRKG